MRPGASADVGATGGARWATVPARQTERHRLVHDRRCGGPKRLALEAQMPKQGGLLRHLLTEQLVPSPLGRLRPRCPRARRQVTNPRPRRGSGASGPNWSPCEARSPGERPPPGRRRTPPGRLRGDDRRGRPPSREGGRSLRLPGATPLASSPSVMSCASWPSSCSATSLSMRRTYGGALARPVGGPAHTRGMYEDERARAWADFRAKLPEPLAAWMPDDGPGPAPGRSGAG